MENLLDKKLDERLESNLCNNTFSNEKDNGNKLVLYLNLAQLDICKMMKKLLLCCPYLLTSDMLQYIKNRLFVQIDGKLYSEDLRAFYYAPVMVCIFTDPCNAKNYFKTDLPVWKYLNAISENGDFVNMCLENDEQSFRLEVNRKRDKYICQYKNLVRFLED